MVLAPSASASTACVRERVTGSAGHDGVSGRCYDEWDNVRFCTEIECEDLRSGTRYTHYGPMTWAGRHGYAESLVWCATDGRVQESRIRFL